MDEQPHLILELCAVLGESEEQVRARIARLIERGLIEETTELEAANAMV